MVQQVISPLVMTMFRVRVPVVLVPTTLLLIQFHVLVPGKAMEDGRSV